MARFDARVPAPLRRLARRLARSLDVEGVYWGTRRRRGVWTDEPCLSVEVHRKHPRRRLTQDRLLPSELEANSTFTYVLPLYGLHQEHPTIFSTFFS